MSLVWLAAGLLQVNPAPAPRPPVALGGMTLFAGTHEGLWRSLDWGRNWKRIGGRGPRDLSESLGAVHAILPLGPHVFVGGEGGLFLSEDWGESWERLPLERAVLSLLTTRYFPVDGTLLVGTPEGLLRSPDAGRTFVSTPIQGTPVHGMAWPGPRLIVATGRGVVASEDGAARFEPPGRGLPPGVVRSLVTSSYYAIDPVLFAAVEGQGVFRSQDGGRTFTATTLGVRGIFDLLWLGSELFAAGEGGVYRSEDAGATWTGPGRDLAGLRVFRLLFPLGSGKGPEAFAATSQGVFVTGDAGRRWEPAGLGGQQVFTIVTFPMPDPVSPAPKRR